MNRTMRTTNRTINRSANRSAARAITLAAIAALSVATGCSSSRFGGPGYAALQPAPAPVQPGPVGAAPAGQVQTGALAPVNGQPQSLPRTNAPANQPLPGQPDPNAQAQAQTANGVQVASANPAPQTPAAPAAAAAGQAISENSFIGNWQTSVNGQSCATFFGLTDLGSGLLGGTRGCPGELARFRTWRVNGNQATLRDSTGTTVATLTKTGDKQFSGTTSGGQGFTLTR